MSDVFQQATAQQGSGCTRQPPPAWNAEATLSSSSRGEEFSTRSTLAPSSSQRQSTHTYLAAADMASQAPGAMETVTAMSTGTEVRIPASHVPLSAALGQAGQAELGDVAIAGIETAGMGAGSSKGAAWEIAGEAGAAAVYLSAQGAAPGGVVSSALVRGNGGGDEEEEDDSDADKKPTPEGILIPDDAELLKRSWCCGRTETIRSICSNCKRRWHCHKDHGLIDMDKDRFICCFCEASRRTASSGCRCHK